MMVFKLLRLSGILISVGVFLIGCMPTKPVSTNPPKSLPQLQLPRDTTPERLLVRMGFRNTRKNRIYNAKSLNGFFQKIDDRANRQVRIVQIGDSHVRGHRFPAALRQKLTDRWGSRAMVDKTINYYTTAIAEETGENGFIFHAMGKNGCTIAYYLNESKMDEIARLQPDLIIISVGTNESHAKSYAKFDPVTYREKLDMFIAGMRSRLVADGRDVAFLLTTPPCSYISRTETVEYVDDEGKVQIDSVKIKEPNSVTADVAVFQARYGAGNNIAVWNLYDIVGGQTSACTNWKEGGLMAKDDVHYTKKAYTLQGELLGQAILNAYDSYRKTKNKSQVRYR